MDIGAAVLWSKRRFRGDLLLEAYITNAEIPAHVLETPRDLNFNICGDGVNLGSGYAFILGGREGNVVKILKQGKLVASSPYKTWRKSVHNQDIWFQIRVLKEGQLLSFFVDGQLAAQYEDPDPIEEGHLGVWTYATGLVLGRLRIWYEHLGEWRPVPPLLAAAAKEIEGSLGMGVTAGVQQLDAAPLVKEVVSDFETGLGAFSTRDWPDAAVLRLDSSTAAKGKQALKVINRASGGHFSVWALTQKVDLQKLPVLSFDYKLPTNVKVNLYVKIGRRWEEVVFAGGTTKGEAAALGAMSGIASDGKWHHVTFDLLEAVKKRAKPPYVIDGLAFASPDDFSLRCGLTGNQLGAAYHLDNFRIGPK